MGADRLAIAAYRRLIARGQFPFRNYAALGLRSAAAWDEAAEVAPEPGDADGRLVVGAVKLWLDGALGSRGAALHSSYCDDPGNAGLLLVPPDELARVVTEASARGFQVCVHAIGDRANTLALDAFERAFGGNRRRPRVSARDHRARIEHAQILTEADVARFRALGVLPSMQATHCTSDMAWAEERLGPDRLRFAYAWRSLLATGALIAGGSDFPVEDANPFLGLSASVTRRPPGAEERGWQPEQRMTREEAVRSFTTWNAHAAFQEGELGSLEPGKRADLIALSEDVFTCPEERIAGIRPVLTMVGGDVVFRA
jgi:predicted amidohydrolase YtcJ